ncbi:MAG: 30S ribosome-binding factor RbfA [Nitrospirae bacterium]|nr:30S ribosome-binding factor RbfA [Nitrospirota bacterium]
MEVADIIMRKIKDPRLGFVTVTDVELTSDLRLARVFVTTLEGGQAEADTLAGLSNATGFIRAELGRRLRLRYTPELIFQKDISGPRGDRLLTILDGLGTQDQAGPAEAEPAAGEGAGQDRKPIED